MEKHTILGVHITNRVKNVPAVQKVLSDHGCNIKTRLGLHDVDATSCSPSGLLVLELYGDDATLAQVEAKLKAVEGVDVQKMVFTH